MLLKMEKEAQPVWVNTAENGFLPFKGLTPNDSLPSTQNDMKALAKLDFELSQTLVETMTPPAQEYAKNQVFYCQTLGDTYVTLLSHDKDSNTCVCRLRKQSAETAQDFTLKTEELLTTIKVIVKTAPVLSVDPRFAEV